MALTLQVLQRLQRVELTKFYEETEETWTTLAKNVYDFVSTNYPSGETIRPDDVAQNLLPFVQVEESLTNKLSEKKLKQKYWKSDFCDLVVDRCWGTITGEE
jgi:hypothetical protein